MAISRIAAWPGGGLQLHVSLMADAMQPADPARAGDPVLRAPDGTAIPLVMQPAVALTRIGIALVRGPSAASDMRIAQHASAIVTTASGLGADVVLWDVVANTPRVMVEPTSDAGRLDAAIIAWQAARPSDAATRGRPDQRAVSASRAARCHATCSAMKLAMK